MDAKELRIGNWVMFSNKIEPDRYIQVNARFFSSLAGGRNIDEVINDTELNGYYQPIPLTPEILEKAGFHISKESEDYHPRFNLKTKTIVYSDENWIEETGGFEIMMTTNSKDDNVVFNTKYKAHVQYVHQLQNLFWILANTDLPLAFN